MATDTRERLTQSAMELFYNYGFHAVGLDRILKDVGVTKTTFYKHFESKDDLILAVLAKRDEMEVRQWLQIMNEEAPDCARGQLLVLFDILREWFGHDDFRGCMFINAAVEFPYHSDPIHLAAAAHSAHLFKELSRIAADAGAREPNVLARQLMVLVAGSLVSRHVTQDKNAADTARATAELLLDRYLPAAEPVGAA